MNIKASIFVLFALILAGNTSYAQADIHFSQFYETSILRNPALTGVFDHDYKVTMYGRSQWSSVTDPYQTILLDAQGRVMLNRMNNDYLSFGLLGYADKAGELNSKVSGFYPSINYNKSMNRASTSFLSVGFTAAYLQYSYDPTKATFDYQFQNGIFNSANPTLEALPNPNMSMYDIGAGINFNSSPGPNNRLTYLLGVSGYHFSQPVFSYYNNILVTQNVRWNFNGAFLYDLSDVYMLQIHGNYAQQGSYKEFIGGGLLSWREMTNKEDVLLELSGGAMYRVNDAIIPAFKVKYKSISVGVSYDVNVSKLKPASYMQGGLEVTASFWGDFSPRPNNYRNTVCPRF